MITVLVTWIIKDLKWNTKLVKLYNEKAVLYGKPSLSLIRVIQRHEMFSNNSYTDFTSKTGGLVHPST